MGTRGTFAGRGWSLQNARCAAGPGDSEKRTGQSWALGMGRHRRGAGQGGGHMDGYGEGSSWAGGSRGRGHDRLRKGSVGAQCWHLHARGPEGPVPPRT